jgi:hypothetical protein
MSARIALFFVAISLFALTGCAQRIEVHDVTSGHINVYRTDSDLHDQVLTNTQLTALKSWIDGRSDWSSLSANIPDHPTMDVHMQDASGQSWNVSVYEHDDGTATLYLYQGHRIAPLRCHLTAADYASFKSVISQQ